MNEYENENDIEILKAMLSDRDRHIEALQTDLSGAREQEQLWKGYARQLEGK